MNALFDQVDDLREVRRKLEARVKVMAVEQKLPSPETLLADAPLFYKTRRFWRYFSPKRRRKTEWGEVSDRERSTNICWGRKRKMTTNKENESEHENATKTRTRTKNENES